MTLIWGTFEFTHSSAAQCFVSSRISYVLLIQRINTAAQHKLIQICWTVLEVNERACCVRGPLISHNVVYMQDRVYIRFLFLMIIIPPIVRLLIWAVKTRLPGEERQKHAIRQRGGGELRNELSLSSSQSQRAAQWKQSAHGPVCRSMWTGNGRCRGSARAHTHTGAGPPDTERPSDRPLSSWPSSSKDNRDHGAGPRADPPQTRRHVPGQPVWNLQLNAGLWSLQDFTVLLTADLLPAVRESFR